MVAASEKSSIELLAIYQTCKGGRALTFMDGSISIIPDCPSNSVEQF